MKFRLDCGMQVTRTARLAQVTEITDTQMIGKVQESDEVWNSMVWTLNGKIDDLLDSDDDLGSPDSAEGEI